MSKNKTKGVSYLDQILNYRTLWHQACDLLFIMEKIIKENSLQLRRYREIDRKTKKLQLQMSPSGRVSNEYVTVICKIAIPNSIEQDVAPEDILNYVSDAVTA